MVNISKSENSIKFVFTDSDHYLYGNGVVDVPVNSLLLVIDESEMVTFKKLSGDPFLSFRADNSNLGTKAAIEQFYKDNMVGSTGGGSESGITSGEVQTMIDESISGKADTSAVTAVANDVSTLSGQVATKLAISDFNTYSAATDSRLAEDEEVTAAALNDLNDNKQDTLVYYQEDTEENWANIDIQTDDGEGNTAEYWFNAGAGTVDLGAFTQYDDGEGNVTNNNTQINIDTVGLTISSEYSDGENIDSNWIVIGPTEFTVNGEEVATEPYVDAALSGKADTSAVTAAIDAATSGKVDTSAITSAITSGSTDSEIPTAKAVYDATQSGGGTSVTIDPTLDTGSTNPVANSAITTALDAKADKTAAYGSYKFGSEDGANYIQYRNVANTSIGSAIYYPKINGKGIFTNNKNYALNNYNFQLVEKSAITSAMTSGSTDSEIPTAKAVYDTLGGLKFMQCTQAEYSAMEQAGTLDNSTLYIVSNVVS